MSIGQKLSAAIGRWLLSFIFILAGSSKLLDWEGTMSAMTAMITRWQDYKIDISWLRALLDFIPPYASLFLGAATVFELLGGLLLFLGLQVRFAAVLLILFLIPVTLTFHDFWFLTGEEQYLQRTMFLKNLSIMGGLFITLAFGKGCSAAASGKK